MDGASIAAIVATVFAFFSTALTAYLGYNQKTKDKMTDLKIQQLKEEEERKSRRRSDNSAIVYGEMYNVLRSLGADRVYIVQPHPLGNESMLSIYYEITRKGISPMKPHIQNMQISEVAKFSHDLVKNLFMYITDIDEQVEDKYAKAILSSYGCKAAAIKRLSDSHHDWVGSIFCEFTHGINVTEEEAAEVLHDAATAIQYILPEYK